MGSDVRIADNLLLATLIFIAVVLSAGCATTNSGQPTGGLEGNEWVAEDIKGMDPALSADSTLKFPESGQASGSTGCNRFNGTVEINGDKISFGPLATTKMACEPRISEQEKLYLDALQKTRSYSLDVAKLRLRDEQGNILVRFYHLGEAGP